MRIFGSRYSLSIKPVIQKVSIRHFKSIRQLDFSCKRVNLFIGEPNTGKSNLLAALGLFSTRYVKRMGDFVRMKDMTNLFFDNNTTERIEVKLNDGTLFLNVEDGGAFYTKYLAETIARDDSNQYFIATHNPYLLLSIVEKMKTSEVGVFITYQENYETRLRLLSEEELSELLDLNTDVFFNFDKFLSK